MRAGRPSRTAQHNALFRALEASRPPLVRLIDDPLASACLTWPLAALRPVMRLPGGTQALCKVIDRRWPGVRTSVVARTRLIDDTLNAFDDDQLGQLVILGAGFDTRSYRLERLRSVSVFEVDHPDTQGAKRVVLQRALRTLPDNVRFVSSDFNLGNLAESITASGYQADQPTVFLWEGVTNYLSEQAVDTTLRWCAQTAQPGSLLIFTYVHSDVLDRPDSFDGSRRLHATLAKVGEKFTFGMDPDKMESYLAERGFERQWDQGAADFRARYFGGNAQQMTGHEFYRVALARVNAAKHRQAAS
jgi:methyltransferase (TIGR00027 family)